MLEISGIFGSEFAVLEGYLVVMMFVLGAIVGSFLNVVIYRFHTGKSLQGHSHCMSCQHRLRWYELFPLVSYVFLRGKCRVCHSYIPVRYFLVELITALGFLAIFLAGGSSVTVVLTGLLFVLLVIVAVYDLYHFVIPNDLVVYLCGVAACMYAYELYLGLPLTALMSAILAGAGAAAFFGGLWKVSNGRWIGFGDVKLALPLGVLAGFPAAFSMVVLSFWVGAVISLTLIGMQQLLRRGKIHLHFFDSPLKMKSEVPFAPFLIAGFILSWFYGVDVLELITYVL